MVVGLADGFATDSDWVLLRGRGRRSDVLGGSRDLVRRVIRILVFYSCAFCYNKHPARIKEVSFLI